MPYNPTTDVGKVRLLISDTAEPPAQIFNDAEISTFLALEDGNLRRGAALALETIASNEVQVLKVIRTQDLQTDGAKVSVELRARAKDLRSQADVIDDAFDPDDAGFDIAEMILNPASARQHLANEALREGI